MVSKGNKKIKILYIITKSNWGGAGRYVYDLATGISKNDFNISVALGGKGLLKTKLEAEEVRTVSLYKLNRDINILTDISVFFNLIKLFKKERPDIIHLNSSKIGGIGALAGRIAGVKKIIFTAHGWAWGEERNIIQKFLIKILSWITILLSHKTIAVSNYDKKIAEKFPFVNKKITTVYNGISKIDFIDKKKARNIILNEQKTKPSNDTIWIGAIGELHKNKGYKYAIKALSKLNKTSQKFILIIIGEGEEKDNLNNLIKEYNLEKNIFIFKHPENASTLLKAFDIFLLPSIKEGLPYTALEAGMAKIPTIATSAGGIPEIIEHLKSGVITPSKKPTAIAESITYLSTRKTESELFSNILSKKIARQFSKNNMITSTTKIYLS